MHFMAEVFPFLNDLSKQQPSPRVAELPQEEKSSQQNHLIQNILKEKDQEIKKLKEQIQNQQEQLDARERELKELA